MTLRQQLINFSLLFSLILIDEDDCTDILNFDITDEGLSIVNNLTASANLLCTWLRLFKDQATCAQPEASAHTNSLTMTKKSLVVGLIFNSLIPKIHINLLGALPQL